jgi:hypothetical protein
VTAALTETPPGVCWDCGGPCRTFKGTEHGWRCRACCARYLASGAAKASAADAKERAKRPAKQRTGLDTAHQTNPAAVGRGGGGLAVGRTATTATTTTTMLPTPSTRSAPADE